jgi:hypothetical protein
MKRDADGDVAISGGLRPPAPLAESAVDVDAVDMLLRGLSGCHKREAASGVERPLNRDSILADVSFQETRNWFGLSAVFHAASRSKAPHVHWIARSVLPYDSEETKLYWAALDKQDKFAADRDYRERKARHEEMSHCTFQPAISDAAKNSGHSRRADGFHETGLQWLKQRQSKLEKLRLKEAAEAAEEEKPHLVPWKLSEASRILAEKAKSRKHENAPSARRSTLPEPPSFSPQTTPHRPRSSATDNPLDGTIVESDVPEPKEKVFDRLYNLSATRRGRVKTPDAPDGQETAAMQSISAVEIDDVLHFSPRSAQGETAEWVHRLYRPKPLVDVDEEMRKEEGSEFTFSPRINPPSRWTSESPIVRTRGITADSVFQNTTPKRTIDAAGVASFFDRQELWKRDLHARRVDEKKARDDTFVRSCPFTPSVSPLARDIGLRIDPWHEQSSEQVQVEPSPSRRTSHTRARAAPIKASVSCEQAKFDEDALLSKRYETEIRDHFRRLQRISSATAQRDISFVAAGDCVRAVAAMVGTTELWVVDVGRRRMGSIPEHFSCADFLALHRAVVNEFT